MFFRSKDKEKENKYAVFPKVQTAEGWKRMMKELYQKKT
jgi:hypothetical protein